MLNVLKKLLYGFLIGISNMIPGFSGGTMILILGIYEEFNENISNLTKTPLKSIKYLWSIILGMVIGIVVALITIVICLEKWPVITSSLFVGLVIASFPIVIRNLKQDKFSISCVISFIISLALAVLLAFSDKFGFVINSEDPNILMMLYFFVVAGISAATMVIPAASGMMILYAFGLYEPVMNELSLFLHYFVAFDFSGMVSCFPFLIPFGLGVIVGLIVVAKLITFLFKKCAKVVWSAILGLLTSSLFTIYYGAYHNHLEQDMSKFTNHLALNIILGVVMLAVGIVSLTLVMRKIYNKKDA